MFSQITKKDNFNLIKIAIIISIILGLGTTIFFLVVNKDSYSAIYIIPDSIQYSQDDNTVLYSYGVKSSESGTMDYTLNTYLNDTHIKTKQFTLNKDEILDERDRIVLPPDIVYPSKISLELSTRTANEEVHFWLKG